MSLSFDWRWSRYLSGYWIFECYDPQPWADMKLKTTRHRTIWARLVQPIFHNIIERPISHQCLCSIAVEANGGWKWRCSRVGGGNVTTIKLGGLDSQQKFQAPMATRVKSGVFLSAFWSVICLRCTPIQQNPDSANKYDFHSLCEVGFWKIEARKVMSRDCM